MTPHYISWLPWVSQIKHLYEISKDTKLASTYDRDIWRLSILVWGASSRMVIASSFIHVWISFHFLYKWIIAYGVYAPCFRHPFNRAPMNKDEKASISVVKFSLGEYAQGWYRWDHSFLRSLYTDIHSGYASLLSYQQWTAFLSLCPCHNLLSFFFLVLPMLTRVGWSHRAIFICISLMEFK